MYHQESDNLQTLLAGEGQLLEMISAGAPLPQILDRVCSTLDMQVGNVVSLVLFPDDQEHTLHNIAQSAADFGLSAFSCTPILSEDEKFFGTLEMYCCVSRVPTVGESELIDRAAHLAALVIQHHNHELEAEDWSLDLNGATRRSSCEGPPSSN
jgi:hypothetical protein